jgi:hypothetical protein
MWRREKRLYLPFYLGAAQKWRYYAFEGKTLHLGLGRTSPISALTDLRNCALCVSGAT